MFKLVRDFTLISLLGMALVVVILASIYREMYVSQLIEHAQRENVIFCRMLDNVMKKQQAFDFPAMQSMTIKQLRGDPDFKRLDKVIRQYSDGLDVLQVSIYGLNGKTLYSTDTLQLGKEKSPSPGYNKALSGDVDSELVSDEHFYLLDGTIQERTVVASYLPVTWADNRDVEAVLHVSADVTGLLVMLDARQNRVYLYIGLTLAALFIILFLIIRSADRNIQRHTSEIERQRQEISWHAYRDSLTGLPNRALFKDRLEHAMHRVKERDRLLAVLYIDLDRFKSINDTLGYVIGDQLLRLVAERLKLCIHEQDTISRVGGDEFAIVLEDISLVDEAAEAANHIIDAMSESFDVDHHEVFVNSSIGISFYPFDDEDIEQLIQKADAAMYQAKDAGRNTYRFTALANEKNQYHVTHWKMPYAGPSSVMNSNCIISPWCNSKQVGYWGSRR